MLVVKREVTSVVRSLKRSIRPSAFLATLSVLIVIAGMLFGANVASADSVWYQSYQRASQTEACAAQPGETPWQASWGTDASWKPSWEQWANAGKGGWVCTRSITWAKTPVPASSGVGGVGGSLTYRVGDIGPGGGLVFLISGGLTYEMAPAAWSGAGTPDAAAKWCEGGTGVPAANGTAIGTGTTNTAAMAASVACPSNAAAAVLAYAPAGTSAGQWFLPSQDELNAMCNYSRNPTAPPTGVCTGMQDVTFSTGAYGFAEGAYVAYWSSSQEYDWVAWVQRFVDGFQGNDDEFSPLPVRPVRAF